MSMKMRVNVILRHGKVSPYKFLKNFSKYKTKSKVAVSI
jgi:hypothetical protein